MYTGYGIAFDSCSKFLSPDRIIGKNVIIFKVDVSSSVYIDKNKGYLNYVNNRSSVFN